MNQASGAATLAAEASHVDLEKKLNKCDSDTEAALPRLQVPRERSGDTEKARKQDHEAQ